MQMAPEGTEHKMEAFRNQSEENNQLWKVSDVLHDSLLFLKDSLTEEGSKGNRTSPKK